MYRFINDEKQRYYNIFVQPDMFSQHTIIIARGGLNHRRGAAIRTYGYDDEGQLQEALRRLIRRRRQRGYNLVGGSF
jgi:predicted DNA-binding WGR domain protein